LWSQTTRLVSVNAIGVPAVGGGNQLDFSGDGKVLVYTSSANNLTSYPPNNWLDVFAVRHEQLSPAVYCTATPSTSGCVASMSFSGTPSATAGSGFTLSVGDLPPERNATLLYGHWLPTTLPFAGGTLCVAPPLSRTPLLTSHGTGPCGASLSFDFNAWIAAGADPALVNGRPVWIQCWTRDPPAAYVGKLNLSDAVYFVIAP
jgi:hypothetical protein